MENGEQPAHGAGVAERRQGRSDADVDASGEGAGESLAGAHSSDGLCTSDESHPASGFGRLDLAGYVQGHGGLESSGVGRRGRSGEVSGLVAVDDDGEPGGGPRGHAAGEVGDAITAPAEQVGCHG